MLTKTKKTSKIINRKNIVIVFCCVIALVIIAISLESFGITHLLNQPRSKTDVQSQESGIDTKNKQTFIENTSVNTSQVETKSDHGTGDITLSTRREKDGTVTVSTQLKNYSDGTCQLTIRSQSSIYTQTADVIYQESFSSCAGFNVPSNAVSAGLWQISLTVTSKGTVNTQSTSLEVQP